MKFLLYAFMAVSVGVMIFGLIKQKEGFEWGKPLTVVGAGVALLCVLIQMFAGAGPSTKQIMDDQMRFARAATEKLGMHLAEKHAGGKALVLTFPAVYGEDLTNDAMMEGLKKGLNGKVEIIVEKIQPELPPGAKPTDQNADMYAAPMEAWFTPERFDKLVQPYIGKVDLLITFQGLPMEPGKLKFWNMKPLPKVVLAGGSIAEFRKAIEQGVVIAAVTTNPKANFELRPKSDVNKTFELRYLLITPENLGSMAGDYKGLFNSP